MLGLGNSISTALPPESKYSLNFDGVDDYLDLGLIDFDDGNFSCSFWFKVAGGVTWTQYAALFDNRNTAGDDLGYQIRFTGTVGEVMLFSDFGETTISGIATGLAVDTWHHIAVTVDRAGNQVLYANGEEEYTGAISAQSAVDMTNALNLIIGKAGSTEAQAKIDDLAVWNVVLNESAVGAIYNQGSPTNLTFDSGDYTIPHRLVAYYKMGNGSFDDKAHGVVHDQTDPGFGAELIVNADFSDYETEDQENLIGGIQFNSWTEGPSTGTATFTSIPNGFRRTVKTSSTSTWHQRVNQNLHETLVIGGIYKFSVNYLTSDGTTVRLAIQTPGSQSLQSGGSLTTTANVTHNYTGYFVCDTVTDIDIDIFPVENMPEDEFFEISNITLRKINGNPGLTSGGPTFSSDTP